MKIAVVGASGFIGQRLIPELVQDFKVVALGRSEPSGEARKSLGPNVEWRVCDLFSVLQTEKALEGVDVAIYLVHSMLPSARLTQSSFENADLALADSFARAARRSGVRRIIFLSGLVPPGGRLSRHLASRLEVETVLASYGCPVTSLRSGMIIGAQGSSFQMMYLLVKRLPVMVCPAWTENRTQCIDARDVVALISYCLRNPEITSQAYDIGAPDVLTYRQLMSLLAREMGVRRWMFPLPYFTPGLSRLWVQLITGAPKNLVSPLIHSLRYEMLVKNDVLLRRFGRPLRTVTESLRDCLKEMRPDLRASTAKRRQQLKGPSEVRSLQRMPIPRGKNAEWAAAEYFRWLPRFLRPWIRVTRDEGSARWQFRFLGVSPSLLELEYSGSRSSVDRQLFYIRGGLLARRSQKSSARLEFREVLGGEWMLAAIHDFAPALPWFIYSWTQAVVHGWVMARFKLHLRRVSARA